MNACRLSRGSALSVTKRLYETSIACLYTLFKAKYPQIKMGLTKFASYRPQFVKRMTAGMRSTCLCTYHTNFSLVVSALSKCKSLFCFVKSDPMKANDMDVSDDDEETVCPPSANVDDNDPGLLHRSTNQSINDHKQLNQMFICRHPTSRGRFFGKRK